MDHYRFYVADLVRQARAAEAIKLSDEEAHHARAVLRLETGEHVNVFDGKGAWAEGAFVAVGKRDGAVTLAAAIRVDAPPVRRVTMAPAAPKGDRAQQLVEQTSQLNVARLAWLDCDRGISKAGDAKAEKWRRLAIESAKQCGRNYLMEIGPGQTVERVLRDAVERGAAVIWLEPRSDGKKASEVLAEIDKADVVALVGPEGGWSPREFSLLEEAVARGKAQRLSLGKNVLRIETACVAAAALLMAIY